MTSLKKIITGSAVALMIGGTMAATPAAAWTRYHDNTGAVVGAAIGGMAVGAMIGAAASQPRYYGGYGYGYPPPPAYGYAPAYGYGYDYDD